MSSARVLRRLAVLRKETVVERVSLSPQSQYAERVLCDESLLASHEEHVSACEAIQSVLLASAAAVDFRLVSSLDRDTIDWCDAVLSLGGDGTFLRASHAIPTAQTPIFGVNSSPSTSVGFFAAADQTNFGDVFDSFITGSTPLQSLTRMSVVLNSVPMCSTVLNDVLFGPASPAETARYDIMFGTQTQTQKSSGVWVSTASGSTGAMAAAGGVVQPLCDQELQFQCRELFHLAIPESEVPLSGGVFRSKSGQDELRITSRNQHAKIFIDGTFASFDVQFGDILSFRAADHKLSFVAGPRIKQLRQQLSAR